MKTCNHIVPIVAVLMQGFVAIGLTAAAPYRADEFIIVPKSSVVQTAALMPAPGKGTKLLGRSRDGRPFLLLKASETGVPEEEFCDIFGSDFLCSPNYILHATLQPDDPLYPSLYGMASIRAEEAWDIQTGSVESVVGVIDTGIDYTHPDLVDNIWVNPGEIPGNAIDDDNNGYIDDLYGYDFVDDDPFPIDTHTKGHGTHVSGTIGAIGNNTLGVAGVNFQVKLIALRFLNSSGQGSLSDAVRAINYVTDLKTNRGVDVLLTNNSWGGGGYSGPLYQSIADSMLAGVLFVAAAGNDGVSLEVVNKYPASYQLENVIGVAAIDSAGNVADFSNYGGDTVHIAAPGVEILSTAPEAIDPTQYKTLSGTSMAAPHVSGALALLRAQYPDLSAWQLKATLLENAAVLPTLAGFVITEGKPDLVEMFANPHLGEIPEPTPPLPTATPTPTLSPTPTPIPSPTVQPTPTAEPSPTATANPGTPVLEVFSERNGKRISGEVKSRWMLFIRLQGLVPGEPVKLDMSIQGRRCGENLLSFDAPPSGSALLSGRVPSVIRSSKAALQLSVLSQSLISPTEIKLRGAAKRAAGVKWTDNRIAKFCRALGRNLG